MPRSPYVIDSHSANATAARLVSVYGAEPIWASSPAADAVEQKYPCPRSSQPSSRPCRGPAMGVDVDVERQCPVLLRRRQVGADGHAGVGEEQVDRAERRLGGVDQGDVARCGGHVGDDRRSAPSRSPATSDGIEDVGDDDAGTGGVEAPGQGGADPPSCSGHDHVGTGKFHGRRA